MRAAKYFLAVLIAGSLAACGAFDSGVEWRGGPYALLWMDTDENVSLVREYEHDGWLGRVDETVFGVGWDGRYVVAKQHPGGNKKITNYFIIDSRLDSPTASEEQVVTGPLSQEEFRKKSEQLKLPEFSRTLASLE